VTTKAVAAIVGPSGSGKTTLIKALIARYVAQGKRVGAIKHTHHPLNEENRGNTAAFRAAGAGPVILARFGEAVIFHDAGTTRTTFSAPEDLLVHFDHDVVLVEGFKDEGSWPKLAIAADARPTVDEAAAILDRIWRSS
jgi:molybdopterin-guanine dinucleotide biosynthesis protein B